MAAGHSSLTGIVTKADRVLLDTCAVMWLAHDEVRSSLKQTLTYAGAENGLLISPVSAWEIGLLATTRGMRFIPDAAIWFETIMARPGVQRADLTDQIAIASSFLPGDFRRDPANRLLVATARAMNVPIVTSDRKILDYARAGHVAAIAC